MVDNKKNKIDLSNYHEMLDWTEFRFGELMAEYPELQPLLFDLRGILRIYQLCMNLILAKADKNGFFVKAMLKTLPKEVSEEIVKIMVEENKKENKKILKELEKSTEVK